MLFHDLGTVILYFSSSAPSSTIFRFPEPRSIFDKSKTGQSAIEHAVEQLSKNHSQHIKHYGHGLEERLTGQHETSSINEFSAGKSDRGCSIRIPKMVALTGSGYLEDRRPGANADPYLVTACLVATICEINHELEITL